MGFYFAKSASAGASYLIEENFIEVDSGGALGSGTDGYDSPLVIADSAGGSSVVNPDATDMTGGKGTYALKLTNAADGSGGVTWELPVSKAALWVHLRFRANTAYSWNRDFFKLLDSGGTPRLSIGISNSSSNLRLNNNGSSTNSGYALASNTTYYIWIKFNKAGACGVYLSTSSTRPTVNTGVADQVIEVTGPNYDIARFEASVGLNVAMNMWYSNLLVSETEIGNDP